MNAAIATHDLVKRFGPVTAVDGVSLNVAHGEIYAFIGLNGAGKTTMIRMLLGMIRPSAGHAQLLGYKIGVGGAKPWAAVGYLVETPHAYPELSVRENLEAVHRLRHIADRNAVAHVIELLGLSDYADRRTSTLSLGNVQRLGLAKALIHQPELLILDEPANGLDPAGIVEIRQLLLELVRERGVTVFMSSHILGEVTRMAHRIGILHQGRLLMEVTAAELEHNRRRRLIVRTHDLPAARALLHESGYAVQFTSAGHLESSDERAIAHPDEVARRLVTAGLAPTMLLVEQEDLEHYFLRLVGMEERRDQE